MRGVSPAEIDAAVNELNALYDADQAPYCIEQTNGGYRLVLRAEFERMRDKFYGKVKEARLSPAALEVLSVLAYNQPATADQLNELRGAPSGAALSTLVRRKLVRLDRPAEAGQPAAVFDDRAVSEAVWVGESGGTAAERGVGKGCSWRQVTSQMRQAFLRLASPP